MKTIMKAITVVLLSILYCLMSSCSKDPFNEVNEVDGSYFSEENTRIVFEDKGYMTSDRVREYGDLVIACTDGPIYTGISKGIRRFVMILVPKNSYTISGNQLSFRNSFVAKIRFCTTQYEAGGHSLRSDHLQQERRVTVDGAIINDTGQDFSQDGTVCPCSFSLSFSLDDGYKVRLEMSTMTVRDDISFCTGWLK